MNNHFKESFKFIRVFFIFFGGLFALFYNELVYKYLKHVLFFPELPQEHHYVRYSLLRKLLV